MGSIVLSQALPNFRSIPLPTPSALLGYSLGVSDPVPTFLLHYSLRMFGPVPTFLLGYSLRMSGPVPGLGCPSPRQSLSFFPHQLCNFILVQVDGIIIAVAVAVALRTGRGASATALAAFGRPRARGAVLAGVSGAA